MTTTITSDYTSPFGNIVLAATDTGLSGLWFEGQKHFGMGLADETVDGTNRHIEAAKQWLDEYFASQAPSTKNIALDMHGTPFQEMVWKVIKDIPYGKLITYGDIAVQIGQRTGSRTSARAVGNAVGRNPVSIIVPCHRVVGANGKLTGYAGGLNRKAALLHLEGSLA